MDYEEFVHRVRLAGLSIRSFAELVGLNPNSLTNYKKKGEVPSHLAVIATLMAAMKEADLDPASALSHLQLSKKAPRGRPLGKGHEEEGEAGDDKNA